MEGGERRAVAARLGRGQEVHSVRHALIARDLASSQAQEMINAKMGWWSTAALTIQSARSLPKMPMSSTSKGFKVRRRLSA